MTTNLTGVQLENFFQNLTLQMLGLDPTATANQSRVRVEWPTSGAPGWNIDQDVAFIMLNYDDDPITRQVDLTYQQVDDYNTSQTISYTRVLRVNWVCYGPNSFNDADTIRSSLYTGSIIGSLKTNNIFLILDLPMPVRAPELFNGQWWDRTSTYARFNELVSKTTSTIPYIQTTNVQPIKG